MRITKRAVQAGAVGALALATAMTATGQANATTYFALAYNSSHQQVASAYYNNTTNQATLTDERDDGYGVYIQFQQQVYGVWSTTQTFIDNRDRVDSRITPTYTYSNGKSIRFRACRNSAVVACSGWIPGTS